MPADREAVDELKKVNKRLGEVCKKLDDLGKKLDALNVAMPSDPNDVSFELREIIGLLKEMAAQQEE